MPQHLLIVDDEEDITDLLRLGFENDGYEVETCANGLEALNAMERRTPELVILDVALPLMDGLEVCRRVRRSARLEDVPILILSALDALDDRVAGLEAGADDYVTKPFAYRELRARVRALLRRYERDGGDPELSAAGVIVDRAARRACREGQPLALTTREFDLLALLVANAGRVLPRALILERVWGMHYAPDSNVLDVCLHSLRRKVGDPNLIHSVRRAGFVFRSQ
ncbi:MAG: response regulator transcription factor [Chloroflexi bacterium]|nr:response regulator transcription factor [Chloroflexota bacterium]